MKLLLRFASGPLAFLVLYLAPYDGLPPTGRLVLCTFAWMVLWWMTQPVPWGISALLPLLLFPAINVMNLTQTVSLYGQNIFFWIWGTILVGYTMERHGLAKRFALWFLSLRIVSGSTRRMLFGFMLVTGLISSHVSDAATVAMMIPVALSLSGFVRSVQGTAGSAKTNIGSFLMLGTMYASIAGGLATIAGVPHNALSVALLERFAGRSLSWFNWMLAGVPAFLIALLVFYFVLSWFFPPESTTIAGGEEFIRQERAKLGPFSAGERGALVVFFTMVGLFTIPVILSYTMGSEHPVSAWLARSLSTFSVPPLMLLVMFTYPINWRERKFLLSWKESTEHAPWNIMFMCASAVAVSDVLARNGFVEWMGAGIQQLGLGPVTLPYVAAYLMSFLTNLVSGTAAVSLVGTILIPAAQQIGLNPASMAMLLPNMGVGLMLPWAGAVAGTTFASGEVDMRNMIRVGFVAEMIFAFLVATVHLLLSPIL